MMQKGLTMAQTSLEISLTRNAMNAQAEAIRLLSDESKSRTRDETFAHSESDLNSYNTENGEIISLEEMVGKDGTCRELNDLSNNGNKRFIIDVIDDLTVTDLGENFIKATVYPRVFYDKKKSKLISEGIWVQASRIKDANSNFDAVDYHIRACWTSVASSNPITLGTIVRIYDKKQE